MEEYTFVRLTGNNIEDLCRLFSIKSKNPGSYQKFLGKYNTKYTGVENIGFFAYNINGEPVAFYGVIPCFALAGNKKILIAQAVDAITLPDHRRKGLFEKIVSLTTELAKAEGIQFIYGVPNDLSYQGFIKKFNWSQNENLLKFQFKINQLPFSYFYKKYNHLNKVYHWYVKIILGFIKKGIEFANPSEGNESICILRNDQYFQYKNYGNKYLIKLCNISVWLSVDGSMKIGDLDKSEGVNIGQVIKNIKRLAFILGARKVVFQFSPHAYWADKISFTYKAETALPVIYYNLTDIYDPRRLILAYGDIDTF